MPGAPGVDGVSIAIIEADGVGRLLEQLAAEVRAETYRPPGSAAGVHPQSGGPAGSTSGTWVLRMDLRCRACTRWMSRDQERTACTLT